MVPNFKRDPSTAEKASSLEVSEFLNWIWIWVSRSVDSASESMAVSSSRPTPEVRRRLAALPARSRTQLFLKYRDSLRTHRTAGRALALQTKHEFKASKNLLGAHSDDDSSSVDTRVYTVPPQWVTLVDDLNRDVSDIEEKIAQLNEKSGKHLLPTFGDDTEQEYEEQIAATVAEISALFTDCTAKLARVKEAKSAGGGDDAVRLNIERRVAQQLQDLSLDFRRSHKQYLHKLKGQRIEDYKADLSINVSSAAGTSRGGGGGFFDDEPAEAATSEAIDPRFNSQQILEVIAQENMSKEREAAITQVAESVTELADIFKEIQVLVIDQGTVLDRIDFNIEQAADRVGAAVVELNKANEYQKKSKTMLCIYCLLLLCGLMVIILLLKNSV